MCGINGIFAYQQNAEAPEPSELEATRDHMHRRGPDGQGIWWSEDRRIGLGHRRLSIIDPAERSNQPMNSDDGRFAIVFNGEIYNHAELRTELEAKGRAFRTRSDTEVLLHLYADRGDRMVDALRGMFAFAIWDDSERSLFLARDPFGIKPLYVADDGKSFRFASQVKALLAGGAIGREHDPAGAVGFFLWGSVPEPFTLFRGIQPLPAGHCLTIQAGESLRKPTPFISLAGELAAASVRPLAANEIATCVRDGARASVRAHLVADVDVGLFLSAGIDSGALLGLMKDAGAEGVQAITLGFDSFVGTEDDEVPLAAAVAHHYGARHTVRRVTNEEFRQDLPAILEAMDQPSIDGVNTWFVAKATHEAGLKVALSGLGGDEILAGYPGFGQIPRMMRLLRPASRLPGFGKTVRRLATAIGIARRRPKLAAIAEYGGSWEGAYLLRRGLFLPFELPEMLDRSFVEEGLERLDVMAALGATRVPDPGSDIGRVAALELSQYTRNQLLRDADWAGMAHSLEIRTPLLDIELLRTIAPACPNFKRGVGKRALAAAPSLPLPKAVVSRTKSGFAVPTGRWRAEGNTISSTTPQKPLSQSKGQSSRALARAVYAAHSSSAASGVLRRNRGRPESNA